MRTKDTIDMVVRAGNGQSAEGSCTNGETVETTITASLLCGGRSGEE